MPVGNSRVLVPYLVTLGTLNWNSVKVKYAKLRSFEGFTFSSLQLAITWICWKRYFWKKFQHAFDRVSILHQAAYLVCSISSTDSSV